VVGSALKYNSIMKRRYRMLDHGDDTDHIPSPKEVATAREEMAGAIETFKAEREHN